jgi:hypothetical protein
MNKTTERKNMTSRLKDAPLASVAAVGAAVIGGAAVAAMFLRTKTDGATAETAGEAMASETDTAPDTLIDLDDAEESDLHAMGTPTTIAVDQPRGYTGDGDPDMAVDYLPGSDQDGGIAPAGATARSA